jgi:tripartite-type tricarboxylate transporter receptor subunit TctC
MNAFAGCALAAAISTSAIPASVAQDYPTKPIRAIVPYAPGGGVDIAARVVGQKLTERWGQQVIVDNRAGANGNIGAELAARAAPDGYTFFVGATGPMAINPSLFAKLSFDPLKDFDSVVLVAPTYYLLVTHPTLPANSVPELVQLAKARGGKLTFASGGVGSPSHLSGEMLRMIAKIDFIHVPYKGTGPALADLLAGHVNAYFADMIAALQHVNGGRLKLLATATPRRIAKLPNTPTLSESGVPGYDALAWTGLFVPRGTPRTAIERVNAEVRSMLKQPEVQERIASDGSDFGENTPAYVDRFLRNEIAKWGKVVKVSGAKAE